MSKNRTIISSYSKEELKQKLINSKSFAQFIISIGYMKKSTSVYRLVRKYLEEIDLHNYIPVYDYKETINNLLIKNSIGSLRNLKKRIIDEKIIDYKCRICDNTGEWNNKKLTLQLEHKNGNSEDNRLENLEFLCPNCHSQTETWCSRKNSKKFKNCKECNHNTSLKYSTLCEVCSIKKKRKVIRPDISQLLEDIKLLGYVGTGKKYGVSDNAIRKWIKSVHIPSV